jgi:hypothetical protein
MNSETGETPADPEISWPLVHKLGRPVDLLGDTYSELTLREPLLEDAMAVLDADFSNAAISDFIAKLAGLPPPAMKKLPAAEFMALRTRLTRFFAQAAR